MHADLGQAIARQMPVAPMGPEGVGEGGKMVSLPRPWTVLGNGGTEEHDDRDKGGGGPPASTEKADCGNGRRGDNGGVGGGDCV
jgi:hypothetical protein